MDPSEWPQLKSASSAWPAGVVGPGFTLHLRVENKKNVCNGTGRVRITLVG